VVVRRHVHVQCAVLLTAGARSAAIAGPLLVICRETLFSPFVPCRENV
jgi:hypothetical protein